MAGSAGSSGPARVRVLIAEFDPAFARGLAATLAAELVNTEVEIAGSLSLAEARLASCSFDAVVLALELAHGASAVDLLRPQLAGTLIATSSAGSVGLAVAAMRAGADDFLPRPYTAQTLIGLVRRGLTERTPQPVRRASAQPQQPSGDFEGFLGTSPAMQDVYSQIARVAASKAPIFITGESGTGKEVTASAVHARSGRADKLFLALNCGAIPKDLMESEIFGHVRGAFTGATEDRAGAAELADGGTLFLDEICEMDLALQAKLLRFVQTGELRRVGDTRARKVDVRFVCATNRDPRQEVQAGRFREDLFYRLHVLPVHLPPLRERGRDALVLARAFLTRFAHEEGRSFTGFDPLAEGVIAAHSWPGNVRELENVVRRIVVLHDGGLVTADMLPEEISARVFAPAPGAQPRPPRSECIQPMWIQEQRIIEEALVACGGNIARAAAALEINPSTIYRKRQSWGGSAAE